MGLGFAYEMAYTWILWETRTTFVTSTGLSIFSLNIRVKGLHVSFLKHLTLNLPMILLMGLYHEHTVITTKQRLILN